MTAPAVQLRGRAWARAKTRELRGALQLSLSLLTDVYDARAWETLGYDSWSAYCAAELPELKVLGKGLPPAERSAVVVALAERGQSLRAIAEPLGLAPNTVRRALDAAGLTRATVTSLDGRVRPGAAAEPKRPAPKVSRAARVLELAAAAGPDGVTVRDVCARTRWSQHLASPVLCRLAAAGRLVYVAPEKRGQVGRYVLPV